MKENLRGSRRSTVVGEWICTGLFNDVSTDVDTTVINETAKRSSSDLCRGTRTQSCKQAAQTGTGRELQGL